MDKNVKTYLYFKYLRVIMISYGESNREIKSGICGQAKKARADYAV